MAAPAPAQGQVKQGDHQQQQRLQKVMVAVDESECSRHALEWVLRNLAPTLAPPLLVLTVQPPFPLGYVSAAAFGAPRTYCLLHVSFCFLLAHCILISVGLDDWFD